MRRLVAVLVYSVVLAGCHTGLPANDPSAPSYPCDQADNPADACYSAVADYDQAHGESAETGEAILAMAQHACDVGSVAACHTLAHYARDNVMACEHDVNVRDACAIAGFVYQRGVRATAINGHRYAVDAAQARIAFGKACAAGAKITCPSTTP